MAHVFKAQLFLDLSPEGEKDIRCLDMIPKGDQAESMRKLDACVF